MISSWLLFLLLSAFGTATLYVGNHIGYREGYNDGYMDGHEDAMTKTVSHVRVVRRD